MKESTAAAYEALKNKPTRANAIAYLVACVEKFRGKQGYYDYFCMEKSEFGSSEVFKHHYSGAISSFTYRGESEDGALLFSASGTAHTDLPVALSHYDETTASLYTEIRMRTPTDVLRQLQEKLSPAIRPYYSGHFPIVLNVTWRLAKNKK